MLWQTLDQMLNTFKRNSQGKQIPLNLGIKEFDVDILSIES